MHLCFFMFFFFFQAEDGIRDWSVTGVQTCALPIYDSDRSRNCANGRCHWRLAGDLLLSCFVEIGRASCRERVKISEVAVALKKNKAGGEGGRAARLGRGGSDRVGR